MTHCFNAERPRNSAKLARVVSQPAKCAFDVPDSLLGLLASSFFVGPERHPNKSLLAFLSLVRTVSSREWDYLRGSIVDIRPSADIPRAQASQRIRDSQSSDEVSTWKPIFVRILKPLPTWVGSSAAKL